MEKDACEKLLRFVKIMDSESNIQFLNVLSIRLSGQHCATFCCKCIMRKMIACGFISLAKIGNGESNIMEMEGGTIRKKMF